MKKINVLLSLIVLGTTACSHSMQKTSAEIFDSNAVANQYEYATGLNYYVKGHVLKFQTDYTFLMNTRGLNLNDHRIRTQAQLVF